MCRLILASASPRRKELLEQVGVKFDICPAKGEEVITKETPCEIVMELALQKALEVADTIEEEQAVVLGADTVVAYEGEILGKPKDREDAIRMITMLSGNKHSVYTGVAIIEKQGDQRKIQNFYEETEVIVCPMSLPEIERYVATFEPMDKAGSYAIQGKFAVYIEKITGDYNNVVGLPISKIYQTSSVFRSILEESC